MKKEILLAFLIIVGILTIIAYAQKIDLMAGHVTYADLYSDSFTERWGGIIGNFSDGIVDESNSPIASYSFGSVPEIGRLQLTGSNFLDGKHYIVAIPKNVTFNLTKVKNVTSEDLEEYGLFNSINFPIFHPDYYTRSDNPKKTFTYTNGLVKIGGIIFNAFYTYTKPSVPEYILKYQINESYSLPMFLVKLKSYTCYNNSNCNFQMILPLGKTYYLYVVTEELPIKLDVWIDGIATTTFSQTGLPYNLTIRATHLYTGEPLSNVNAMVFEDNGNNIFVPMRLSGKTARGISFAPTDPNGFASFIVVPTNYTNTQDYSIGIGVYSQASPFEIPRRKNLTISNFASLARTKKPIAPSNLADNVKVSVNAMNQIVNTLYKWANEYKKAWMYRVVFYTNGSYYIVNLTDYNQYPSAVVKTGAPNVINLKILNPDGTPATNVFGSFEETNGYLVMNPSVNAPVVSNSTRLERAFEIYDGDTIVITPTSYGNVNSGVEIKFYTTQGNLVGSVPFSIDKSLDVYGGSYYENGNMKVMINAMNSVVYSVYYAIN